MTIDTTDLKAAALACDPSKSADETQHSRRLAEFYDVCEPEDILALLAENEVLRKDADRYQVLREADIDTIHNGGLFAGLTPDNIVINGHHLDERTDAVIAARKAVR
jgi:hypothetical protein